VAAVAASITSIPDPTAAAVAGASNARHPPVAGKQSTPRGLSLFTALHPQNELQWKQVVDARIDPLVQFDKIYSVLKPLKSIKPRVAARDDHDKY
jgi:hypothetical protein